MPHGRIGRLPGRRGRSRPAACGGAAGRGGGATSGVAAQRNNRSWRSSSRRGGAGAGKRQQQAAEEQQGTAAEHQQALRWWQSRSKSKRRGIDVDWALSISVHQTMLNGDHCFLPSINFAASMKPPVAIYLEQCYGRCVVDGMNFGEFSNEPCLL